MPDVKQNDCVQILFYVHEVSEKIWLGEEKTEFPKHLRKKPKKHLEPHTLVYAVANTQKIIYHVKIKSIT